MKRILFVVLLVLIFGCKVYAAPHHGDEWELRQPDGSMVPVRIWGDEFHQSVETPDGFTLIRDENGWITYAKLSPDSLSYVSTGVRYTVSKDPGGMEFFPMSHAPSTVDPGIRIKPSQIQKLRLQNMEKLGYKEFLEDIKNDSADIQLNRQNNDDGFFPAPTPGAPDTIIGLTILIDFSDQPGTIAPNDIDAMFNQRNYSGFSNFGSVMDYFYDQSNGQLVFINMITQYIRVTHPKTYYDTPDGYGPIAELIQDALTRLAATGFDFSRLSREPGSPNTFRALSVLYAGSATQGWANGLWPHMGTFRGAFRWNGIRFQRYQLAGIGTSPSIGAIIHESGHLLLRLPDLYSYDGAQQSLGRYCVMASIANRNRPQFLNAHFRHLGHLNNANQRRHWTTLTDISNLPRTTTFTHVANSPYSFVYYGTDNGSPREMYFIEARRRTGWDAHFPDSGLVIWHVNLDGDNTRGAGPPRVFIKQADVTAFQRNDLFRAGLRTTFNDDSPPPSSNARWHNSNRSGLSIIDISAAGATMNFTVESENQIFDISISSGPGGTTTPIGITPAAIGEEVVITMTPDPGFRIDTVLFNGRPIVPVNNTITIVLDGNIGENNVRVSYAVNNHFTGTGNFMIKNSDGRFLVPVASIATDSSFIIAKDSLEAWGRYWNLSRDGNVYNIEYHNSGFSLGIAGASTEPGASAILGTIQGENQNFYIVDIGNGIYHIRPIRSMLSLTSENATIKIDDGDETFITFSGNWITTEDTNYYNNTRTYSNTADNHFEFSFVGTAFRLITSPSNDRGIARIYINGVFDSELDLYSAVINHQQIVYQKEGLPMGETTVRVVATGRRNPSSRNSWVMIDAIEYSSNNLTQAVYNRESEGVNFRLIPFNYNPTVTIVSPVNNLATDAPATVLITAEAADNDGEIALVEFFANNNKIGETTAAPFTITWDDIQIGEYTITATATDNFGATTQSEPVNIQINAMVVSASQQTFVLKGNSLVVAPNPVVRVAKIFYSSDETGEAIFEILTPSGKSVATHKKHSVAGVVNDFYFDDSKPLPRGEYFMVMTINGTKKGVVRFFKTK